MIVVADSSPLIALINVEQIGVLPSLFGRVFIPDSVANELESPKRPAGVRALIAAAPNWLVVRTPKSIDPIEGLDAGETAAISLAIELNAGRIIMDEKDGRVVAKQRGLVVIGTVGLLEAAAELNLVDLADVFAKLRASDFWLPAGFLHKRLELFALRSRTSGP